MACESVAKCNKFLEGSHEERWSMIKGNGLCRQCLTKHAMRPPYECKIVVKCTQGDCKGKHHPLMHQEPPKQEAVTSCSHRVKGDKTQFRYVPVVLSNGDQIVHAIAFFDEGSNGTFIEEETAKKLKLFGPKTELCLKFTGESH